MWPTLPARCFSTWPIAAGRWRSCRPPKSTSACCPPSTNLRVSAGKYLQRGPRRRVCVLELRLWRARVTKPPAPPAWASSPLERSAPPLARLVSFLPPPPARLRWSLVDALSDGRAHAAPRLQRPWRARRPNRLTHSRPRRSRHSRRRCLQPPRHLHPLPRNECARREHSPRRWRRALTPVAPNPSRRLWPHG